MARTVAAVIFSLGCLQASSVMALGLGEINLDSYLNEPLTARVDLLNIGTLHSDEIRIRLATREDFEKLGMERTYFLSSIQFEVVAGDGGKPRIVLTTDEPVLEPYLDFIVEARWPSGRLLREYTVLVDPPVFSDATPTISASARVEEVEGIPAEPAKKKDSTAVTSGADSGTRVDTLKSDLAPGEMPQRDFNAATANTPTPGSRYMIARDQTLWDVASKARPDGVSVHQTMLDIQRLNPNAFINGNINRVKAGYIVYLPTAQDISNQDASSALAQVREQNEAWKQGTDAQLAESSGPSLRISADVEPGVSAAASSDGPGDSLGTSDGRVGMGDAGSSSASSTSLAALPGSSAAGDEEVERVAAMQQQLDTLQRIVSLKDEQIAALQDALADDSVSLKDQIEADLAGDLMSDPVAVPDASVVGDSMPEEPSAELSDYAQAAEDSVTADTGETSAEPEIAAAPAALDKPASEQPTPSEQDSGGGWFSWVLYALGAAILAVLAFLFVKRRRDDEGDEEEDSLVPVVAAAPVKDVFADVELKEPTLDLEVVSPVVKGADDSATRGYGERKHDEYASDVEAADALAEADIYIAYGRHPQAIDLLNNALTSEPDNPVYRLKLLEIYSELNDQAAAQDQLHQLRAVGDEDAIARGEALLEGQGIEPQAAPAPTPQSAPSAGDAPGLPPNPLKMMGTDTDAAELEADFAGLEIEQDDLLVEEEDDLDLSADFEDPIIANEDDDDELVIAADANGLSTKLDLARAYLDMGDDDGARQILEEVVAEGKEELRAEAQALLDRIG